MRSEPSQTAISLGGGFRSSAMTLPVSGGPLHIGRTWRCSL